ncbi:MAG: restriction endonuclease subunit S [Eubacterium sp.]|nr:restriction endonuclease subunit S [Eubacterium sp.]
MTAQQLKNSILQMAVQGKLVTQDPKDEPASVLLERIRAEKEKLIKEGKIKKEKNPSVIFRGEDNLPYEKVGKNEPVCIADEVPFEIPESWEWCRLKDITIKEIKRGKSPKYADKSNVFVFAQKCNVKTGGIDISLAKYLEMSNFSKYSEDEYMIDEDIVVNSTGNGTLGRIGMFRDSDRINNNVIVPDSHVTIIRSNKQLCSEYVLTVLEYYQPTLEKQGEGSTNQTELKPGVLADLFFPLPPYCEQKRIVKSILSLKAYVEKYKQKETKLSKLNSDFPETLKKSILQQAVMGKLVPQDERDEPSSVLLEKIRTEKHALIKAGKLKKDKHESIIYRRDNSHYEKIGANEKNIEDGLPFEIPYTWGWVRLKELCVKIGSGSTPTGGKTNYVDEGIKFLRSQNVYNDGIRDVGMVYITESVNNQKSGSIVNPCDILLNITGGSIGRCAIVPENFDIGNVNQHVMIIRLIDKNIRYWVHAVIVSPYIQKMIMDVQVGVSREGLSASKLMDFLIPIPPQAEMSRILRTIDNTTELLI